MYSTCLFCHAGLGANEVVERFPVGRRLAFDAEKGRLWVVCRACARWNLTPLEERWEAIEDCERRYRESRVRVSTDNVGLARLSEGLELVRVGRPLRPEMAAWRYGRILGRRYVRDVGWRTLGALGSGVMAGSVMAGVLSVPGLLLLGGLGGPLAWWVLGTVVVDHVRAPDGRDVPITRRDLREVQLLRDLDEGWALSIPGDRGNVRLAGPAAASALGRVLVHLNHAGASPFVLGQALERLGRADSPATMLRETAHGIAAEARRRLLEESRRDWWGRTRFDEEYPTLLDVDRSLRLALEMALHEDTERAAAEGELAALETAWREAEEIAAIADRLALPEGVTRRLAQLRGMESR
jgi:hypothetical protein